MLARLPRSKGRAKVAVAAGIVVALVLALTGITAILLPTRALAAQSTLTVLSGICEVRSAGEDVFTEAEDGAVLGPGATVRTGTDANAVITFFDGSTVTLEPESELTIEQLEATGAGDVLISMLQTVGRSWHVIAHSLSGGSQYQVRALGATASVRGTAFEFDVDETGNAAVTTTDGEVATTAKGKTVQVGPGQKAEVPADAPPKDPEKAPEPAALVKVIIDATTGSAAAFDAAGRSVGVANGRPVRYAPGSTVEVVGGKLVMTIPTKDPGRISTVVQAADGTTPVTIETRVESKGTTIARTVETRKPDESGHARGGVVTTTSGVLVLPDSEAKKASTPNIAAPPAAPRTLFSRPVARATPLVTERRGARGPASASPTAGGRSSGAAERDDRSSEFKGGFQAFATATTKGPSFVTFTGDLPDEVLSSIPSAPRGPKDPSKVPGFRSSGAAAGQRGRSESPRASRSPASGERPESPRASRSPEPPSASGERRERRPQEPPREGVPFTSAFPGQGVPFTSAFPGRPGTFPGQGQPFASPGQSGSPFEREREREGSKDRQREGCRDTGAFGVTCAGPSASRSPRPNAAPSRRAEPTPARSRRPEPSAPTVPRVQPSLRPVPPTTRP